MNDGIFKHIIKFNLRIFQKILMKNMKYKEKNINYQITCKLPLEQYSLTKQSGSRHAPINRTRYSLCISLILILQKQQL
jgi:hypothetical protein